MALRPDEETERPVAAPASHEAPQGAVVIPPAQVRRALRSTDLDQVVMTTKLEKVFKMATANSMWPFGFGLACCAMEMIAMISSARYDVARFGSEVVRATPLGSDIDELLAHNPGVVGTQPET